tara:strand:+ start:260 stop:502 length:243 start_codon:yes stop_codon:yes gene_type:complete
MSLRDEILNALVSHAEGEIAIHKANVEVYLNNPAGIGEHSDILPSMQKELDSIAAANDRLEILHKYFHKSNEQMPLFENK